MMENITKNVIQFTNSQETLEHKKKIIIDFLYLDLSICNRCQGTETNMDTALEDVAEILDSRGYEIVLNRIHVTSREIALKYEFLSSPTIRVNGQDIDISQKETLCESCGDLCGENVNCRVWSYKDEELTTPPKEMIIDAILKEVESKLLHFPKATVYELPQNLKVYFDALDKEQNK